MTIQQTLAAMALLLVSTTAQGGTLDNLERERAILIGTLLSPEITYAERETKVNHSTRRLVDLERMVWRDSNLAKEGGPSVKKALDNFDLTFLVHASIEKDRLVVDHWLEQLGLTSTTLSTARMGRR
ncbi:hypothetical protein Mmc1_0181 [Magnetococcus marinus MC-1]|uniref:Uncharacterized protein n=1 Tax=Magnetococcus marinus (strain ATCC BAA-1437 / JCM 17883 / MC-1) TaxID=156889 RepID=A0L415_MAGMM|nr:hypothetical protein [Magnetococcus marinus]ABK42708.1 hypothetical protein Mmc1_0181 [Magnetococcus marinus MC-1]